MESKYQRGLFFSFISFSVVFLGYFGHSDEENNNRIENNSAVEMQVKLIEVTASIDKKENETAKDQRSKLKLMQVDNEEKEKLGAFMSALSLFESGYFYDIAESIFNSKEFEEYRELAGDSLKVPTHSDQDKISLIVGGEFEMLWREPLESLSLTDFEKASVGQLIYNDITLRAELNTMLANFEISRREYDIELAALPSLYASLESHISLSDIDQLKNAQGQVARERDFSPELYSALEDMKKNPAYSMVYSDDFEALENYLSSGLDVGQTRSSKPDFSLIDAAVSMRSPRIVRLLIDYGADINTIDADGDTPLHRAASQGSLEIIKALLNAGADVDAKNDMGLKAASVAKIAELSSLDESFDIIVELLKSSEEG
ncbi:MAG: ankyrin repeat domain-containing protein [Gammaproteobacteria bacterium]|nr:ankyrin repeat domain-containing protein [Gammaproteobacteria bacterium]